MNTQKIILTWANNAFLKIGKTCSKEKYTDMIFHFHVFFLFLGYSNKITTHTRHTQSSEENSVGQIQENLATKNLFFDNQEEAEKDF